MSWRLPELPPYAEVQRIVGAIRSPIHRGCFSLIHACGLRISEAAPLEVTATDKASGLLRIVGKGNKERLVPVPRPVHESFAACGRRKVIATPRGCSPNSQRSRPVASMSWPAASRQLSTWPARRASAGRRRTRCPIPIRASAAGQEGGHRWDGKRLEPQKQPKPVSALSQLMQAWKWNYGPSDNTP